MKIRAFVGAVVGLAAFVLLMPICSIAFAKPVVQAEANALSMVRGLQVAQNTDRQSLFAIQRRVQTIKAPEGHRWVEYREGTVVVPRKGTPLISQGLDGLKCVCRVSGLDKCTHLVEDDGVTAKCFSNSTGGCGSNDNCMFKGAKVPGKQLQFQGIAPRVAQ